MADKPDWAEDFVRRVMRWEFSGEHEDTRASDVRKLFADELRARVGASDDGEPVDVDKLAMLLGAVKRLARDSIHDTVEFDGTVIVDRWGTITICNGKIGNATMKQFRAVCELLGIALPASPKGESQ